MLFLFEKEFDMNMKSRFFIWKIPDLNPGSNIPCVDGQWLTYPTTFEWPYPGFHL